MPEPSRWEPIVETLRANGFDAQLTVGFLNMVSIDVDLGDSWTASITTGNGDLEAFERSVPIQVNLDGPGMPGEGYQVTWWPETTDIERVAAAVAPLLSRVMSTAPQPTEGAGPEALDVASAEVALRAMLLASGTPTARDPRGAWRTFSTFALRPVAGLDPTQDEDLVLFETGGREINLTRQFTREDELEQLICTVQVVDKLSEATVWGPGGSTAIDWISEVEVHEAFRVAMATRITGIDVHQSPV
jgi:hypothetical protein